MLKKTPKKVVLFKDPKEPAQKKTKFVIKHPQTDKEKEKEKEKEKKKAAEKPEGDQSKETSSAAIITQDKAQGPEVIHITGLDQPLYEKKKETSRGKGPEVVKPTKLVQVDAPTQTVQVTSTTGGSAAAERKLLMMLVARVLVLIQSSLPHPPIGPKDTLGDIYYKTYTEEARGNAPPHPPWGLKQKDTFLEFSPCRDWFLNSFPPGEVNRQRARTDDGLYHAYVVGEANTHAANHPIVREWRTMVKERGNWEKYHERLLRQVKDFEKAKAALNEEKAKFEADRKSEEWGHEGLRGKLRAAEDLLVKERADWKKICEKDNQRMYAARAKITDFEAQTATLTQKVEDLRADKERVETELKAQVASRDKDMHAKDVEIAELKRGMREQTDKS
ncbi:hypothetical protein Hanom_Chr16g01430261 [Helianthus anomalus]